MKSNDTRSKLSVLLRFVAFLALTALVLVCSAFVLERKNARRKYRDFFTCKDQIDILLLGNSHVVNGLNPLLLWQKTGYSAYNLGCHAGNTHVSYWILMNALDYCSPELVIVDTNLLRSDNPYLDMHPDGSAFDDNNTLTQVHHFLDAFPYSATKKEAVFDLVSDPKRRWQYLFPVSIYHNRWDDLTEEDFPHLSPTDMHNRLMGAEMNDGIARGIRDFEYDLTLDDTYETKCTAHLRKILDACAARGIRAVLTCLPYNGMNEDMTDTRVAQRIANEYGVPFLNYMDASVLEAADIDLYTDLRDNAHLNRIGAEKATAYLASYLSSLEHTGLTDHRGDPAYNLWETRLAAYLLETESLLVKNEDPVYQLYMMMHYKMNGIAYLRSGSAFLRDREMQHLLLKMSGSSRLWEAVNAADSYLLLYNATAAPVEAVGPDAFEEKVTFLGKTSLVSSGAFHNLHINGVYENNLLDMEKFFDADLQLTVYHPDAVRQYYYVQPGEILLLGE